MSASPPVEQLPPDHEPVGALHRMTWQEHQAAGDEAWNQAVERTRALRPEDSEELVPLDEATVKLYEQVSDHIRAVIFLGPEGPPDPFNLLKLGGSQAARAEATPVGVFEEGWRGDKQSGLQDAASANLQRAAALLMGESYHTTQALANKVAAASAAEVMTGAAVEAAEETDTAERVAVGGIARAKTLTPQGLKAEGIHGMERYIGEHGAEPDIGAEFILRMSTKAVEQLTGEHDLPLAA